MKKKFIKSVLLGFPVGIAVYFTTCLIYSIVFGDGTLHMTDDILITFWGSEVNAVIYHVLYWALFMSWMFVARPIWNIESLSILKRNLIVYGIFGVFILSDSLFTSIIKGSYTTFIRSLVGFVVICIASFVAQYLTLRKKIKELNEKIQDKEQQ